MSPWERENSVCRLPKAAFVQVSSGGGGIEPTEDLRLHTLSSTAHHRSRPSASVRDQPGQATADAGERLRTGVRPKLSPDLGWGLSSAVAAEPLAGSSAACAVVKCPAEYELRFYSAVAPNKRHSAAGAGAGFLRVKVPRPRTSHA